MKSSIVAVILAFSSTALSAPASTDLNSIAVDASNLVARDSCDNGSGQCVTYYSQSGYNGVVSSYKPDCSGACFQYDSFQSLGTNGNIIYGIACSVYSDDNCNNEVKNIPNHKGTRCDDVGTARSMRCYYNC
jgi:hypothetical protein